jgi:hypothetical protein
VAAAGSSARRSARGMAAWEPLPEGLEGNESTPAHVLTPEEIATFAVRGGGADRRPAFDPAPGLIRARPAPLQVDEKMPELERAALFLAQGFPVQQRMAIDRCAPRAARRPRWHGAHSGRAPPRPRPSREQRWPTPAARAPRPRSLPALLRARGRAAFDALREPLEAALDGLDADAEVGGLSSSNAAAPMLAARRPCHWDARKPTTLAPAPRRARRRPPQVASIEAWAAAARERLMPAADLAECLLPPALEALRDNREGGKEVRATATGRFESLSMQAPGPSSWRTRGMQLARALRWDPGPASRAKRAKRAHAPRAPPARCARRGWPCCSSCCRCWAGMQCCGTCCRSRCPRWAAARVPVPRMRMGRPRAALVAAGRS